jgi:cysteine synthase
MLAHKNNLNHPDNIQKTYKVEGTGYDFFPKNFDFEIVDEFIKTDDRESFLMARRLIKEEGLLVGGSSGSAMYAAIEVCKRLPEGKRVVVLLPDSVRNYMTKYLNNDWMLENGMYTQVK